MAESHHIATPHQPTAATPTSSKSVDDLRHQTQEAGRAVAQKAEQLGDEIVEKAQQLGEQGREAASAYFEQGRQQAEAWEQELERQIREKPLQSIIIAGGIGLLLGVLLRR